MWVIIDNPESKPDTNRVEQLPYIDEALQLELGPAKRPWRPTLAGRWIAQLLLAMLLGALLPLQYMLQHQARLLQDPTWRPVYQVICAVTRCTLPARTDLTAIRSERLRIVTHPANSDYLKVDIQLFNAAPFPQPFPVLELSFTDIRGQVVAADRLQPADYLPAADLSAMQLLAASSLRPLTLTLLNPGEHAVNYQLALSAGSTLHERKLSWSPSAMEARR